MRKILHNFVYLVLMGSLSFGLAGCQNEQQTIDMEDSSLNFGETQKDQDSESNKADNENSTINKDIDISFADEEDTQIPSVFYLEIEGTDVKTTGKFENDMRPGDGQPMLAVDDDINSSLIQTQIGSMIDLTYNGEKYQYTVFQSTGCAENLISDISGLPLVEENTGEEQFQIHSTSGEDGQVWLVRARKIEE